MSRRPPLPDELIHEIFLKLPVKSLLRFSCVCKSWKTLISNPQFVKDHLDTAISDHHQRLASFDYDGQEIVTCSVQSLLENPSTPAPTLTTFKMDNNYSIIGSINGLLCLRETGGYFRLWNPSTRFESNRLPPPPILFPWYRTRIGFGYDQANDKYKVFVNAYHNSLNVTLVHTFGTDSWTTVQNFPRIPDDRVGKFVSGKLHWLAETEWVIISFDMEKETYGELSLPMPHVSLPSWGDYLDDDDVDFVDDIQHYELGVLNDCLYVCHYSDYTHWVVWLMKEYGLHESWTKLFVFSRDKLRSSIHLPVFHPLCILENGLVLAKAAQSLLILYNTNNGVLDYVDMPGRFGHLRQVYHESLVSP